MTEQPYIYTFDADLAGAGNTPLTAGINYQNLITNLNSDAEFALRRVAGFGSLGASFRLFGPTGNYLQSAPIAAQNDYLLIPELVYPRGAQIRFDLNGVSLSSRAYGVGGSVNNYYSQVAWVGVKRFPNLQPYQTPYKFYDRPYQYTVTQTVSDTGRVASAYQALQGTRQYTLEINDYDFELETISILITPNGGSQVISDSYIKMMLYDQYQNQFFQSPVVDSYLNYLSASYNSVWPCPTVVYPVGSFIRYDIQSLLIATQVPATLQITFGGIQRKSC